MVFRRSMRRFRGRRLVRRRAFPRRTNKRLFRRRRVAKAGNVIIKANSTQVVTLGATGTGFQIDPSLSTFPETAPFITAYENYRIRRIICRVRPNFNIGWPNPQTGAGSTGLAPYVIAAWHKAITSSGTLTVSNALSIDKHKYVSAYRGTRMAFTPAVQLSSATAQSVYQWKPQLNTTANGDPHYCGIICWPAPIDATNLPQYTVELQAHIEFMNQKINIV